MHGFTNRLVALFEAHPYVPFNAIKLSRIAGICAWRTRVSEARTRLASKGAIANTQTRKKGQPTNSYYTFVPKTDRRG